MKECECETELEVLFLKPHEDWNDLYSTANVLYKFPNKCFHVQFSKDDDGKIKDEWLAGLHPHVKFLYSVIKSVVSWCFSLNFASWLLRLEARAEWGTKDVRRKLKGNLKFSDTVLNVVRFVVLFPNLLVQKIGLGEMALQCGNKLPLKQFATSWQQFEIFLS